MTSSPRVAAIAWGVTVPAWRIEFPMSRAMQRERYARSARVVQCRAMTTIYHDRRRRPLRARRRLGRRRRLRQPGPLVGPEPARLRASPCGCACGPTRSRDQAAADGFEPGDLEDASTADIVCMLVPDDVIPSLPISRDRPTASRSWRAGTRSRSTASIRPATSG